MSWGNNNGTVPLPPVQEASTRDDKEATFLGLAELLPRVAMDDRTVIITEVNEAWARSDSLLDLYLEGFRRGEDTAQLLNHVLIVALDTGGFDHCKAKHPHCYLLEVKSANLSSAKRHMTKDFIELVWTKIALQQRVLELGYNFLFTDADMILFRNPLRHIATYADMSCSLDNFRDTRRPLDNPFNTGFYYMKSTNRTVEMVKRWQEARARFPGKDEQYVFVNIKNELIAALQVRIEPLDTVYFSGFCEYHDDLERICTMHANCCIGLENKVHDLSAIAADWKNYTGLSLEERKKGGFMWTAPARCRNSFG